MSDSTAATITTTTTTLRRHSSLNTPKRTQPLSFLSRSLYNLNLDTLNPPLSSSYTSLRDILPSTAATNSPTATAAASSSCYEIPIRNHLVKQAAWAYLQPMSGPVTSSPAPHSLRRLRRRFTAFVSFINHHIIPTVSQVFHRILHALCAS
ncbi:hypothetical protein TanjilG_19630 [Lupinus angustifolius]|uniref:Uncharacterized protein n=1 Tax=Lupinus angustifolius TaxID=3871 RepID=A0A1J7HEY0_LUPAN|nr:hypothetical protein TanjilG_19630 [Lupinus angustifolius]